MGALVGAVVGDLLGIPHEFSDQLAIPQTKRLMPTGGGPFRFPPGVGSDDTDLLFAAIDAYDNHGFDAAKALDNMIAWFNGIPLDVGTQTASALLDWSDDVQPKRNPEAQGNGGLMRAAAHGIMGTSARTSITSAVDDTGLTHPSQIAEDCSALQALMVWRLIHCPDMSMARLVGVPASFGMVAQKMYQPYDRDQAAYSGHCVHSLRLAKHVLQTATSYEEGVQRVIRTGGDTDTNAAIAGALLGARFGEDSIPRDWIEGIDPALRDRIESVRSRFKVREDA